LDVYRLVRVGSRDVWGWGSLNLVRPLAIKLTIEAIIIQFEKRYLLFFIVQKKGKQTIYATMSVVI
jgi:hypothetical protein